MGWRHRAGRTERLTEWTWLDWGAILRASTRFAGPFSSASHRRDQGLSSPGGVIEGPSSMQAHPYEDDRRQDR
ncbi:MAG: hypothetical protein ACJA2F_001147 [Nitriliruptoraceae bacterium]|jgi:hypothetical protein